MVHLNDGDDMAFGRFINAYYAGLHKLRALLKPLCFKKIQTTTTTTFLISNTVVLNP